MKGFQQNVLAFTFGQEGSKNRKSINSMKSPKRVTDSYCYETFLKHLRDQ